MASDREQIVIGSQEQGLTLTLRREEALHATLVHRREMSSEAALAEVEVAKQRYAVPARAVMRWSTAMILVIAAAIVAICFIPGLDPWSRGVAFTAIAGSGSYLLRPLLAAMAQKLTGG